MPKVTIDIPADWSKSDLNTFLKYINRGGEEQASTPTTPTHHCYLNQPCLFWYQDGEQDYQGHCGLHSCACITAIFNKLNPTRWMPKN